MSREGSDTTMQGARPITTLKRWFMQFSCCGLIVRGTGRGWSSRIVKRIDRKTLETSSGRVYQLKGSIDEDEAKECGIPREMIKEFKDGFPENWEELVDEQHTRRRPPSIDTAGDEQSAKADGNGVLVNDETMDTGETTEDEDRLREARQRRSMQKGRKWMMHRVNAATPIEEEEEEEEEEESPDRENEASETAVTRKNKRKAPDGGGRGTERKSRRAGEEEDEEDGGTAVEARAVAKKVHPHLVEMEYDTPTTKHGQKMVAPGLTFYRKKTRMEEERGDVSVSKRGRIRHTVVKYTSRGTMLDGRKTDEEIEREEEVWVEHWMWWKKESREMLAELETARTLGWPEEELSELKRRVDARYRIFDRVKEERRKERREQMAKEKEEDEGEEGSEEEEEEESGGDGSEEAMEEEEGRHLEMEDDDDDTIVLSEDGSDAGGNGGNDDSPIEYPLLPGRGHMMGTAHQPHRRVNDEEGRSDSEEEAEEKGKKKQSVQRAREWENEELIRLGVAIQSADLSTTAGWEMVAQSVGGARTAVECREMVARDRLTRKKEIHGEEEKDSSPNEDEEDDDIIVLDD